MKKSQRITTAVMAAAMLAAMTGCGEQEGQSSIPASSTPVSSAASSSAPESSQPEEKPLYPVVTDGSITLKYWCSIPSGATKFIENYSENTAYQEIMKNTGINIEFTHPVAGQEKEQFNVMMLSGQLPDIVGGAQTYQGGVFQGVKDGYYVDLAPYLEENAPDYYALINSTEEARRQCYHEDSVCAFYPLTFEAAPDWLRPVVRQDFLDEFEMDDLKIYDDYEKYFQNIQDNHPDVTPFVFNASLVNDLNQMMAGYDMVADFYVKDGKIQHYYVDDNLLPFLTMMNSWYEKGYISKDSTSLEEKQAWAMYQAGQLGCVIMSVDTAYSQNKDSEILKLGSAPYPRKVEDQQIHTAPLTTIRGASYQTAVTATSKNIEAAIKFLNYGYTEEGSRIYNYGVEGDTWTLVDGEPKYTEKMLHPSNGMTASNTSHIWKIHFGPKLTAPDTKAHPGVVSNEEALAWRKRWSDDPNVDSSYRIPPFTLNEEESAERAQLLTSIETYAKEMILRFITGAEPLSNFDSYREKLNSLQMDRVLEITQAAYDRYSAQ